MRAIVLVVLVVLVAACSRPSRKNADPCVINPGFTTEIVFGETSERWHAVGKVKAGIELKNGSSIGWQFETPAGTVNDLMPRSDATLLQMSPDSDATITGFCGGIDGRILLILNAGTGVITLDDEGLRSMPRDRIRCPEFSEAP